MATDYQWAMQKALYAALDAALSVPVYDGKAPHSCALPYVTVGDVIEQPADSLSGRRTEAFVTLSVWSRYRGKKEVSGIVADIDAALHEKKLAMEHGRMIRVRVVRKRIAPDIDGETFMGSVTLRVLYEF
jgi:hypothetical protein